MMQLVSAGGDGQDFRPDGPCAANVQRCVADHDDLWTGDWGLEHAGPALQGDARNLVAILMVIGEGAGRKLLPEIEVTQFDFGTELDIAGEEAEEWWLRQGLQLAQERPDARTSCGFILGEKVIEPEDVAIEEAREVLAGGRNAVPCETLAHETEIGAAREAHMLGAVGEVEFGGEDFGEGFHPGAAGADKGSVNIEKHQFCHAK